MKFDSVLLRDTRKFFNFISLTQPLLAKHIIPEVKKAKPVPAEMTLSRLAQAAPTVYREALTGCRAELSDLLERLRAENRRSEALCRHTSELLQASYGVIRGLANGPVYQREGRMQGARLNGKLLCSEI